MLIVLKSEKIKYLFWGVVTTAFYLLIRFISMYFIKDPLVPVYISQIATILFAFYVNKYFVFQENTQSRNILIQLLRFIFGRLIVAALDIVITYLLIKKYSGFLVHYLLLDHINYNNFPFSVNLVHSLIPDSQSLNSAIVVLFIQVAAIILNYVMSKWFIFD